MMRFRGRLIGVRHASHAATPRSMPPHMAAPAPSTSTSSHVPPLADTQKPPLRPATTLPPPRIDYKAIAAEPAAYTANHVARRARIPVDTVSHISRLYTTTVELRRKLDSIRAKHKDVGQLMRMGGGDEALRQAKKLKLRVAEYEKVLQETESELMDLSELLPNATHPDVPHGDESKAIELERFGPEPSPADQRRDHLDICNHFDWLDSSASAQATGSSWPYLKGALAILEHALVQYALSIAVRRGFLPVQTPDVIKEDIMARCGFRPRDPSQTGQTYYLSTSSPAQEDTHQPYLVLAATAEIPLAALTANQILPESSLPIKYVGHGRAFRAEAGARGADTRGLYRVHQFTKLELFAVTRAEESDRMMEELRSVQRDIFEGLGLSCRVLDMPTEELGASAYRKYDVEAWMPGRGKWGEISSTSNCTDFQSRRLHIRHRSTSVDGSSQTLFAHTLNGTATAVPRLMVALIESGARFDGNKLVGLDLPKVLQQFWIGSIEVGQGDKRGSIRWV